MKRNTQEVGITKAELKVVETIPLELSNGILLKMTICNNTNHLMNYQVKCRLCWSEMKLQLKKGRITPSEFESWVAGTIKFTVKGKAET